jgi:hypothetical protein
MSEGYMRHHRLIHSVDGQGCLRNAKLLLHQMERLLNMFLRVAFPFALLHLLLLHRFPGLPSFPWSHFFLLFFFLFFFLFLLVVAPRSYKNFFVGGGIMYMKITVVGSTINSWPEMDLLRELKHNKYHEVYVGEVVMFISIG